MKFIIHMHAHRCWESSSTKSPGAHQVSRPGEKDQHPSGDRCQLLEFWDTATGRPQWDESSSHGEKEYEEFRGDKH